MITVAILGATGMLGSMILDVLAKDNQLKLIATARNKKLIDQGKKWLKDVDWRVLDAEETDASKIFSSINGATHIINAIGVIKPYIHDNDPVEVERAIRVNSFFPYFLAHAASKVGAQILQIATDCVYSGVKGGYVESDQHDPLDVYGKTKSLGETYLPNVHHLRCSIIGPEPKAHISLLEWFRRQPKNAVVNGYRNHRWNGITTLHFARICHGIITGNYSGELLKLKLSHLQHIVPKEIITKADMLYCLAREYHREDITIMPVEAKISIDRTLTTENDNLNRSLWIAAGYTDPPTVPQMIMELAKFNYTATFV